MLKFICLFFRSQSQPPNRISPPRTNGSEAPPSLPNVPPKIDRQKKPSRRSGSSSNNNSGSNINNSNNNSSNNGEYIQTNSGSKGNSLERHSHIRDMKMVSLTRGRFHQHFMKSMCADPKSTIKIDGLTVFLCFWDLST